MSNMKIFLASDHAGFELKKMLHDELSKSGLDVIDKGPIAYNPDDDYPNYIEDAAEEVSKDTASKGIIIGGSGQGEAIVANRFPHVRAVVFYGGDSEIIKLSREHNDANILSLGARFISDDEALVAVKLWLSTPFSNEERHVRRIKEIDEIIIK